MYDANGKNVVVVGLGKSGVASVRFLAKRGAKVTAMDAKRADELEEAMDSLSGLPVSYSLGLNDPRLFSSAEMIVISPGVPNSLPGLGDAVRRGVPVIGEMELAACEIEKPIVAVTGTNGKTTTTALLGHLLKRAGVKCAVGGNIGTPVLDMMDEIDGADVVVLEVSSFQIDTSPSLRPKIGLWLNISPDHLDRHSTLDAYIASKAKMFENMTSEDYGIYNAADDAVSQAVMTSRCKLLPFDASGRIFSKAKGGGGRAWYEDGDLWIELEDGTSSRYSLKSVSLCGIHNRENMLAALLACEILGADSSGLRDGLESFKGLPHRMELVCESHGVKFYDDSKGTNIGATMRALEECAEPVVLIAGGISKGVDFSPLEKIVSERVKHLVLIGESASRMEGIFKGKVPITRCGSMDEAVGSAIAASEPGDIVLLSPACASFDMFRDYADRGEAFVRAVKARLEKKGC